MSLQPGQILAEKYRIVRLLGQGGMGAVYEGENVRIHRRVAIKTLHAAVATNADVLQRFEREAQAAGRIGSKYIVEVLDFGDLPDGSRFMVMEFLDGTTLSDRIKRHGRMTPRDVVPIMLQLLEGLQGAHDAGIIHRDLKPANVFLSPLGRAGARGEIVKILHFGVSKFSSVLSDEMSMTKTGAVMGTPFYMSPEQAKGARGIDHRSDVYSAGVILYEAITGQVPFSAETFNELIFKIALDAPPPAEQFVPNLDPVFGAIVRRAMAREPSDRYGSASELAEALDGWARVADNGVYAGPPSHFAGGAGAASYGPVGGPTPAMTGGLANGGTVVMGNSSAMPEPATLIRNSSHAGSPMSHDGVVVGPVSGARIERAQDRTRMIAAGIMAVTALVLGAAIAVLVLWTPKRSQGENAEHPAGSSGEGVSLTSTNSSKPVASKAGASAAATATASDALLLTSPSNGGGAASSGSTTTTVATSTTTTTAPAQRTGTSTATARPTSTSTSTKPAATTPATTGTPPASTGRDIQPEL